MSTTPQEEAGSAKELLGLLRLIAQEARGDWRNEFMSIPTLYVREAAILSDVPMTSRRAAP